MICEEQELEQLYINAMNEARKEENLGEMEDEVGSHLLS